MPKTITIRNIPEPLYRKLKKRAAAAGLSLPRYVLRELDPLKAKVENESALAARRRSMKEFLRRLHSRTPVTLTKSAAEIIREHRGPLP